MATTPGPPGWVKFLLDVHHSPRAAERLRTAGLDVVTAAHDPDLAALSDDELLRRASSAERAVVTENAKDFDRIVRGWVSTCEHHSGVIFTSPRRFHRGSMAYPENLVVALTRFLANPP
ncbi:MAG: DUF5615 family PIN-like protein, partial [Acidimicrobiales bacterium]